MKKEFITPVIETEVLSAQDSVMARTLAGSDDAAEGYNVVKDTNTGIRVGEDDHWYGLNR